MKAVHKVSKDRLYKTDVKEFVLLPHQAAEQRPKSVVDC
jgi:hypothetical protein